MPKTVPYGWLITHDPDPFEGLDRTGTAGPSTMCPDIEARLRAGDEGWEFRMRYGEADTLDESASIDEDVAYYGRFLANDGGPMESAYGLAPLHQLGTPDAGCTLIEYHVDGRWVAL